MCLFIYVSTYLFVSPPRTHRQQRCLYIHKSMKFFVESAMGWLRLVGSLKLQVSFAEYSLFYRALLQKRPIILSILLTEATPYPPNIQHNKTPDFPVQPIVERVAQNLESISENFQFCARRTRILIGFRISTILFRGTKCQSHRQNYSTLTNI